MINNKFDLIAGPKIQFSLNIWEKLNPQSRMMKTIWQEMITFTLLSPESMLCNSPDDTITNNPRIQIMSVN